MTRTGNFSGGSKNKYINIGLTILAILILFFLIGSYYNHKVSNRNESFLSNITNKNEFKSGPINELEPIQNNIIQPQQGLGKNEVFQNILSKKNKKEKKNQYPKDSYPKDSLTATELLPTDANSKWAQVNPSGQGELGDQNFLEAGFHMGTNTIGQTLRNANLQLRSEPPNPQVKVSPWMQTTIEPDSNRKGLEIGS
jgi:hypothetical protein